MDLEDGSPEESTFETESHRWAGRLEVIHLAYVASGDWARFWRGELGMTLDEPLMNAIFFQYFVLHAGRTITVLTYALTCLSRLVTIYRHLYRRNQPWPFNLIAKCESIGTVNEQLRKFQPSSDLLVLKSNLPRLIVQVNSKPRGE